MLLWDAPGSAAFVLTAFGLVVIVGVYVVSNLWKEPHYKVILGWDPEALPADWEAGRQRYFAINWIQMATTWTACALFLVALGWLEGGPRSPQRADRSKPPALGPPWLVRQVLQSSKKRP